MMLDDWALRWNVPPQAIAELRAAMGASGVPPVRPCADHSEAAAQQVIRLEAPIRGVTLWRNNRGATFDERGHMIRYGLANDSAAIDKVIKSSDLIGITPYRVTAEDIGRTLGVFTSYEVKPPGWRYGGTYREKAQLKWIELIISRGGIAKFVTGPGDIWEDK